MNLRPVHYSEDKPQSQLQRARREHCGVIDDIRNTEVRSMQIAIRLEVPMSIKRIKRLRAKFQRGGFSDGGLLEQVEILAIERLRPRIAEHGGSRTEEGVRIRVVRRIRRTADRRACRSSAEQRR